MESKVAVITGSTSGIGLGIAHHLAAKGCSIVVTGLGEQKVIDNTVSELRSKNPGIKVNFVPCDLTNTEDISRFCQQVKVLHPDGIDILVNNAGTQHIDLIEDFPKDKWDTMIGVTLTASFLLVKEFISDMKKKGWGRIINMSSQMGVISAVGKAPYSAAKAGLIGLTKGVALEAAANGVTCNAICPGFTDAPMFHAQIQTYAEEHSLSYEDAKAEIFKTAQPNQKPVTIDQCDLKARQAMKGYPASASAVSFIKSLSVKFVIADLAVFLCSPGADSINGATMMMDGGNTIR